MPREKVQLPIVLGCVIHSDRVLLIRRNEPSRPTIHGKWEFPGGKLEFGEAPERAAEREILEETGNKVRAVQLLPFTYVAVRQSDADELNVLLLCYKCRLIQRRDLSSSPPKISEIAWLSFTDIDPYDVQAGTLQFLRYMLAEDHTAPDSFTNVPSLCYVTLTSIEADENRRRVYEIRLETDPTREKPFRVLSSWGRLPHKAKSKIQQFEQRAGALDHINELLVRRRRNKYKIAAISDDFPRLPPLNEMQELHDPQGRLFE